MNIIEQAAKVLAEIDEQLALAEKASAGPWKPHIPIQGRCNAMPEDFAFIAASRTGWPTALRCLKTAIEGLLFAIEQAESILNINWGWDGDCGASARAHDIKDSCEDRLTSIITQWNENK